MYAIIEDRGAQIKVQEGDVLEIDLCDKEAGSTMTFEKVLLVSDDDGTKVGAPLIKGATVEAEVIGAIKGKKLRVVKYRRRKDSRSRRGHRQHYTRIRVTKIA